MVEVDIFNLLVPLTTTLNPGMGPAGNCLIFGSNLCADVNSFDSLNYLFWDIEHPTSAVHKLIAKEMLRVLKESQVLN